MKALPSREARTRVLAKHDSGRPMTGPEETGLHCLGCRNVANVNSGDIFGHLHLVDEDLAEGTVGFGQLLLDDARTHGAEIHPRGGGSCPVFPSPRHGPCGGLAA